MGSAHLSFTTARQGPSLGTSAPSSVAGLGDEAYQTHAVQPLGEDEVCVRVKNVIITVSYEPSMEGQPESTVGRDLITMARTATREVRSR